ncbi:MAG TPA: hypothetical protein VHB20_17160 [Verrucomicrobiae bacterium]|jgi:hypothetical protein|nr:hypothetical protein [Verrucomicrobiae bacterium]
MSVLPVSAGAGGRPLGEWNAAYAKVERYFYALQLRNKVVLGKLVLHVLDRAMERAAAEPNLTPTELAVEEMDRLIIKWFEEILGATPETKNMLPTRGRLALILADMPGRWQDQFLAPGPWPEEFVTAMREAYLRAGPEFQLARMDPRPLDLGPMGAIVELTQTRFLQVSVFSTWTLFILILIFIFIRTH